MSRLVNDRYPLPTKHSVRDAWTLTPGTAAPAGSRLGIVCTVAGNVSVTMESGATFVFPVAVGLTQVDFSVTKINTAGTTATATYTNLA